MNNLFCLDNEKFNILMENGTEFQITIEGRLFLSIDLDVREYIEQMLNEELKNELIESMDDRGNRLKDYFIRWRWFPIINPTRWLVNTWFKTIFG